MAGRHVDAVIVGSGAGGGVVAKELSEGGLRVVVLERGGWPHFGDLDHDELSCQFYGVLRHAFGPDDRRHRRVLKTPDGSWQVVLPTDAGFGVVAACVGSGTATYGALAWRFMPQEFRMRTIYGAPEGSTLEDWPITYQDMEPCHEKLACCRQLLGMPDNKAQESKPSGDYHDCYESLTGSSLRECPVCHRGHMHMIGILERTDKGPPRMESP